MAVEETAATRSTDRTAGPGARDGAPDGRGLARNFVVLTAGECVAKLLTFAAFVYLGRVLGPERYGSLEFVLAVMVFFTLPAELGLGVYGAREIAKDPASARSLLQAIPELRLLLASASFLALLLLAAAIPKGGDVRALLALYGLSLFAVPTLLQWFFQGHNLMHWVAVASITRAAVFSGLLFLFLRPGSPLFVIGLFELVSVAVVSALCVAVIRFRLGLELPRPRLRPRALGAHLRRAAPIGMSEIAWAFLWYFATVTLGLVVAGESLGWFGASHRVVMALHTFVWLYFFNLLPSIARCVPMPKEHLLRLMRGSLIPAIWGSFFVALMTTILARELLALAYGPSFAGGSLTLSVLVWMVPLATLSGHYRYTLIAYDLQRVEFYCTAAAGAVSVALGLVLIPRFGAVGAASALLAANLSNLVLAYACVRRRVATIDFRAQLVRPLLATGASLGLFLALARLNTWVAGSLSALAYLTLMIAWEPRMFSTLRLLVTKRPSFV
jgi:O-antigen/teichoic acid export membrane protein